ncbi:MAG: XdhC family protein [Agathobacter rectalis]
MYHHKKNGSAPRGVGTQMLVSSDNRIVGTIGGGCAEALVISRCRRLFRNQEFKCELIDVSMNTDDAENEEWCAEVAFQCCWSRSNDE